MTCFLEIAAGADGLLLRAPYDSLTIAVVHCRKIQLPPRPKACCQVVMWNLDCELQIQEKYHINLL